MSSPSGTKRRPLSTSGYEPLLEFGSSGKPEPPPKPKPHPNTARMSSVIGSAPPSSGGYFQPGGSSSIGYCLSSIYKGKLGPKKSNEYSEDNEGGNSSDIVHVPNRSQVTSKPKFKSDDARPPISALPAKFRLSYEERNRKGIFETPDADPHTGVLVSLSESPKPHSVRRPPPPVPSSVSRARINSLPAAYSKPSEPLLPLTSSSSVIQNLNSVSIASSLYNFSVQPNDNSGSPTIKQFSCESNDADIASPSITRRRSKSSIQPVTFAQPSPRELNYTEKEHCKHAFEYLEKFRRKGELCDATIIVNSKELKAHRVVLAACSQYFESMFIGEFAEPSDEPVIIEEVNEDALEALIDFAYTSQIKITERNVYSLFETADILQFNSVRGACFKFFKQQINKSNCIRTWLFAESHNCTELIDASQKYIECNFLDIVKGKEFLDLDQWDVVFRIISLEDLAITSEDQVYEAALAWICSNVKRKKHALEVFKGVRFPSVSKDYLMNIVDNEPLIKEDPDLLQLLIDGLESHVTTTRGTLRRKQSEPKTHLSMVPRAASMAVEVVDIHRHNAFLGLRIMGGTDRPQHILRQGDKPGVFILKVLEEGAAFKVNKLRVGDRILEVNNTDMTKVTHEEAIRILKTSSDPLSLVVRHEPPPKGMNELTLVTKPGEGFGFSIIGGVNGYPGNPLDETDEGIFISQIVPGGAAEQDGRLKVGTRILQVNSVTLLGKTHDEALKVLQGVLDRLNLLVCEGYDPDTIDKSYNMENRDCV